jgi:hypothetical protein
MSRGITLAPSGLIIERVESEAVGLLIVATSRVQRYTSEVIPSDVPSAIFVPLVYSRRVLSPRV